MAPSPAPQPGLLRPRLPKPLRAKRLAVLALAVFAYFILSRTGSQAQWRPLNPHATTTRSNDVAAVANETLGFHKVFVINRAARSDRRDSLEGKRIPKGNIGSWRAHLNVLRTIVEEGLETALILEDDIDWDVRLKEQLRTFSLASRAFLQPLAGDPHGHSLATLPRDEGDGAAATIRLSKVSQTHRNRPRTSPRRRERHASSSSTNTARHHHDQRRRDGARAAAPPPAPVSRTRLDRLAMLHPPRTRAVHASRGTTCTLGYAVSRSGARKLLWRFGVDTFTTGFDLMLRDLCDGRYHPHATPGSDGKRGAPVCLTVQPPLFSHFSSGRGDAGSDIQGVGGGYMHRSGSQYIRLSVKQNLGRLVDGASVEELVDQWPDDKP
ncbi:hypothetical protein MAPG_02739 [Magnaporthiopsis poae ATCC 64411]|uniref:Glycosyltransferase family 25 protein n=1 Tax=Magnaporthiopsis poae (strain ATCC 64411 / 73-15) TaxID=644358 RepID=A0A0C4DS63_MAGP6|nr:hypothetical protein MAPG_02739 [Magnaporthiopsis poae ATCC 64411]